MRRIILLVLFCVFAAGTAAAQNISTVAGGGSNNVLPKNASMDDPIALARDNAGNWYIMAYGDFAYQPRVYKVDTTGKLTVFAGNGVHGYSGDGGLATSAELGESEGLAVDSAGNVYISDLDECVVRMVDHTSGKISTVVGTAGTCSYTGDGQLATSATLNSPRGLAVDASDDLYIADFVNHVVRMVDTSGTITTVAGNGGRGYDGDGGLATAATMRNPSALAFDATGNLYIADQLSSVIRMVYYTNDDNYKIITTVAGNGQLGYSGDGGLATSAKLYWPGGVAVDGAGNLYIADTFNGVIRMVNASTKIITTVAGNGTQGYDGDNGLATSAELNYPWGLMVDPASGDLYIADSLNFLIRLLDTSFWDISTIAGNGWPAYSGDGGLATNAAMTWVGGVAFDANRNMYIVDGTNSVIREVDRTTGNISTVAGDGWSGYAGDNGPATQAELNNPADLAIDANNNIYIADAYNSLIRKVDHATGNISTVAGTPGTSGYGGDNGPATSALLDNPGGVKVDADGNIFFADSDNEVIRKVDASGTITNVAGTPGSYGYGGDNGPATSATLAHPLGIALDTAGNLYIADVDNYVIRRVDHATGYITTVAGTPGSWGYAGDNGLATSATLNQPNAVALDAAGNVYIADTANNVVRRVDPCGTITTVAGDGTPGFSGDGGPATSAKLYWPGNLAVLESNGNAYLYIADGDNFRVRMVGLAPPANAPPAITSATATTFTEGLADSFLVMATGFPVPSLTESGDTLPTGVVFTDLGGCKATLSGTPAAGTAKTYNLTFTASNGVGSDATQNFTLAVEEAVAITSAENATFTVGTVGSFTVTATASSSTPTLAQSGTLPTGVTFHDNGDGTATLSGTPATGMGETYNLTFTASVGGGTQVTQNFTLTVHEAPAFTSANSVTFTAGTPGSFQVTARGFPLPGLTESGSLPSGVSFTDNGDGTATLAGTAAKNGNFKFDITAHNGIGQDVTQKFTLVVKAVHGKK